MTKRQFLAIMYLLTGVIPLIAQTFTEQKKSYPVSRYMIARNCRLVIIFRYF